MLYSDKTKSFYDEKIKYKSLPEDIITISKQEYQQLLKDRKGRDNETFLENEKVKVRKKIKTQEQKNIETEEKNKRKIRQALRLIEKYQLILEWEDLSETQQQELRTYRNNLKQNKIEDKPSWIEG